MVGYGYSRFEALASSLSWLPSLLGVFVSLCYSNRVYHWVLFYPFLGPESLLDELTPFGASRIKAFLLNSMAYVSGRCDLHPLNTTWERFRFRFNESASWTEKKCIRSLVYLSVEKVHHTCVQHLNHFVPEMDTIQLRALPYLIFFQHNGHNGHSWQCSFLATLRSF